jgi:hypothetical protein
MNTDYPWERLYKEAVLETDDARLRERVDAAQAAIDARLYEFSSDGKNARTRADRSAGRPEGPQRSSARKTTPRLARFRE